MPNDEILEVLPTGCVDFMADKAAGKPGHNLNLAAHLCAEMIRTARRRLAYVLEVEKLGPKPTKADVLKAVAAIHERLKDRECPALSSIYRWRKRWNCGFRNIQSLLPPIHGRSHRVYHQ